MTFSLDALWHALVRAARAYAWYKYGFLPTGITLHGPGGTLPHREPFPHGDIPGESVALPCQQEAPRGRVRDWNSGPEMNHLSDFRSVYHPDTTPTTFHFAKLQKAVVKELWSAMEDGTWTVGQDVLLRKAGAESPKLLDLFKNHAAWGTLIIKGECPGTYRLAPVRDPEDDWKE